MLDLAKLDMSIISAGTLMHIIDSPNVKSVTPYIDRKGLQCYSVLTVYGERYKVFTRGKVL